MSISTVGVASHRESEIARSGKQRASLEIADVMGQFIVFKVSRVEVQEIPHTGCQARNYVQHRARGGFPKREERICLTKQSPE